MPSDLDPEVFAAKVPQELRDRTQWVVWRAAQRSGRLTKIPYDPRSGRMARTDTPGTWADLSTALDALRLGTRDGVGFVFTEGDPYTGIDLDNAIDEHGEAKPWARSFLDLLPRGAYVETSPSGRGLHAIVRACKPGTRCKKAFGDGAIEIYDQGRYFTMTGQRLGPQNAEVPNGQEGMMAIYARLFEERHAPQQRGTPSTMPDRELLDRAFASRNGARIRALWDGNHRAYGSQSEADLSLCSHLWFWSGGDTARVDSLFRQSGLMRPKWNRADYREATIAKAASGSSVYGERSNGRILAGRKAQPSATDPENVQPTDDADQAQNPTTHLANAWRVARHHGHELAFVPGLDFLVYDGRRWEPSKTKALRLGGRIGRIVCTEAAEISRKAAATDDQDRRQSLEERAKKLNAWARASEQGPTIRESLKLVEPLLEQPPDAFDACPLLLNVENGTVDLRSGNLQPHDSDDLLTTQAPVRYEPKDEAPQWQKFVSEIMGGRERLARYLQKALGYSVTGAVSEQALFFAYGKGQNGKSTLLDTVRHVLGPSYVTKAAPNLLMAQGGSGQRHPSEVADLRGARIVVSQERIGGKAFDAEKLKELTGERWIKARKMYGDWFGFEATFKLWLAANHRPQIEDNTLAFWRRIHLIPFTHTIEHPVRDFDQKLAAEAAGILNWLIEGARLYLDEGLDPPPEVTQAVDEYRSESDSLGQFITECCDTGDRRAVKAKELWVAYSAYANERGLGMIKKRDLKTELLDRGFERPPRRSTGFYYTGLALRAQEGEEPHGERVPDDERPMNL